MTTERNLTPREHQVLNMLAGGQSFKQIKAHLGISYRTVKVHVQNAKTKAGVHGPVHRLVVWYINNKAYAEGWKSAA